jgi:hypothetical protein
MSKTDVFVFPAITILFLYYVAYEEVNIDKGLCC